MTGLGRLAGKKAAWLGPGLAGPDRAGPGWSGWLALAGLAGSGLAWLGVPGWLALAGPVYPAGTITNLAGYPAGTGWLSWLTLII